MLERPSAFARALDAEIEIRERSRRDLDRALRPPNEHAIEVSLGAFAVHGVDVDVRRHMFLDDYEVIVTLRAGADVVTKERDARVTLISQMDCAVFLDPDARESCIRHAIRKALLHELDEWLTIDGVRRDPHEGEEP